MVWHGIFIKIAFLESYTEERVISTEIPYSGCSGEIPLGKIKFGFWKRFF